VTDLSPAAQAVLGAFQSCPADKEAVQDDRNALAAALRAAADEVVPHEYVAGVDAAVEARQLTRLRLLAIAAELEAQ